MRRFAMAVGGTALALGSIYAVAALLDWLFADGGSDVLIWGGLLFATHSLAYGGGLVHGERDGAAKTCMVLLSAFKASSPDDYGRTPTVAATIERLKQREQATIAAISVEGATPLLERMHRDI